MGLLSKFTKKESNTQQPPVVPTKNENQQSQNAPQNTKEPAIPELPPLDLPDIHEDSQAPNSEKTENTEALTNSPNPTESTQLEPEKPQGEDLPQFEQDVNESELPQPDEQETDDEHALPELDEDEVPPKDESELTESLDTNNKSQQNSEETPKETIVKKRIVDTRHPIFIEQQLYGEVYSDVTNMKHEVVQIQKYATLLDSLNKNVDTKLENYKSSLSQMQKKLLQMEKKLFENNIG